MKFFMDCGMLGSIRAVELTAEFEAMMEGKERVG
jgi:hypothetical protein